MRGRALEMRRVRDSLRLSAPGTGHGRIASDLGRARSTVGRIHDACAKAGLTWPVPADMADAALGARAFENDGRSSRRGERRRPELSWAALHRDRRRPNATLAPPWEDYGEAYPHGYGHSRVCDLYRAVACRLAPSMRQGHIAGVRMVVDHAGAAVPVVVDVLTGEVRHARSVAGAWPTKAVTGAGGGGGRGDPTSVRPVRGGHGRPHAQRPN